MVKVGVAGVGVGWSLLVAYFVLSEKSFWVRGASRQMNSE